MKISESEKRSEAVKRMRAMKLYAPIIRQFKNDGLINLSEPPVGACYWLNDSELSMVQKFQEEHNAVVYHVIKSFTELGTMYTYLYVGDHKDEWPQDWEDLKNGYQFAYVENVDAPDCSEFGTIGFRLSIAGGLKRTA